MSEGEFQFNMWGIKEEELSGNWDWKTAKERVKERSKKLTTSRTNANGIISDS